MSRERRWNLLFVAIVAALFALVAPSGAEAQDTPGSDVDPRARIENLEPIIAPDGELWLRVHFEEPWQAVPYFDIFSTFFGIVATTEGQQGAVGWELHDGVESPARDSAERDDIAIALLADGTVVIATGLFPGEDPVDVAYAYSSWLDESTSERQFEESQVSFTTDDYLQADPLKVFSIPVYNLTDGTLIKLAEVGDRVQVEGSFRDTDGTCGFPNYTDIYDLVLGEDDQGRFVDYFQQFSPDGGRLRLDDSGDPVMEAFESTEVWTEPNIDGVRGNSTFDYAYISNGCTQNWSGSIPIPAEFANFLFDDPLQAPEIAAPQPTPGAQASTTLPSPPTTLASAASTTLAAPVASTLVPTEATDEQPGGGSSNEETSGDESSISTGVIVLMTAGGLVVVGGGAYALASRRRKGIPEGTAPGSGATTGAAGVPLVGERKDEQQGTTVRIISNGGDDSVNKYQIFRVAVEIPVGEGDPPGEIEIEVSASSGDDETLTLAWDDRYDSGVDHATATYVSQPITLDKGAMGEGTVTLFGFEFTVGGFEGLWFDDGEEITISYDGVSTTFIGYESWVDQGIARNMAVIAYWKAFWEKSLKRAEGIEGERADKIRENAKRGLEWAAKAEHWFERDDALETTKLAWIQGFAYGIQEYFHDPRDALKREGSIARSANDKSLTYKSKVISENGYQISLGLYRTVAEATFASSAYTLFFDETLMGQDATWDEQLLAAFELGGWAGLAAGFDARGLADSVGGTRAGRAARKGADADPEGKSPPHQDPFSAWDQPFDRTTGDFDPTMTLGGVRNPATLRQNESILTARRGHAKDVYVHGGPAGSAHPFSTDSGRPISVDRVAAKIEASGDWKPGVPVRLVSCHSASSGAASDLAKRLNTKVTAPTHRVSIKPDGTFEFLGDQLPIDPRHPNAPRGYAPPPPEAGWIQFDETGAAVGKIDQAGNWSPM